MINSQSSRRSFISSMAILSVGAAWGSVTNLFSASPSETDLHQQWKHFCRQHGGRLVGGTVNSEAAVLQPCKGHRHETGELMAFPQHNLLAQPTWVYWSEKKNKPADLIITFYKNDAGRTKLNRLNRFEWEALQSLAADDEQKDAIALMKEPWRPHFSSKQHQVLSSLKVNVQKGRQVSIYARLPKKEITFNKQFSYSI